MDFLSHLPANWRTIAVVPKSGELGARLFRKKIETIVIPLPAIRLRLAREIISCFISYFYLLKNRRPKLIYANGSRAALYGGIIGRLFRLPVIWHCRIADRDIYLDTILGFLCNRIIVNSKATASRFSLPFQNKVKVIYNGIDTQWLKDRGPRRPDLIRADWKIILIVSRISKWKRHDLALSAFENVARLDPKLHLVCVGGKDLAEPDWWNSLCERTRRSSFSTRIHWISNVEDVRPWYRAASVLILASNNEAFGRVVVEAMSSGIPVIATRSGGIPEIINHGQDGILVTPGNTKEIIEAIKKIVFDGELRYRITRFAKKRAQFFELSKHVKKMIEVFEDTIETHC